jgi:hypothetical protein
LELDGEKPPMGHKKAKKELNGKKKSSDALADFSGKKFTSSLKQASRIRKTERR